MTGTVIVLVLVLIGSLLGPLIALVVTFLLAKRNGQSLKSMSWSRFHGYTATFFEPKKHKSGKI